MTKNEITRKIIIPVVILAIPFYLLKLSIFGLPANVLEMFVFVSLILSLFWGEKFNWKNFYRHNKIYIICVALIFAGLLISTLINENYRAGFGIIKGWLIIPLAFAFILYKEIKNPEDLKMVLKWLYFGIFGVAVVSLAYLIQGDLTYDGRLKGFCLSPNYLAMYLSPAIMIGLWLVQNQKSKIKNQNDNLKLKINFIFYTLSFFIIATALYLTFSYAAWLAVISSLIILCIVINKRIKKYIIFAGLITLSLAVISQWKSIKFENIKDYSRSSLESRIMIWKSAVKIIEDNPVWGIGPGNFQNKYLEYQKYFPPYLEWAVPQPHNLYLAFWLEAGMLGLIGFIILIYKWLKNVFKVIKNRLSGNDAAVVLAAIMIYILLHGLVDTPYWKNDLSLVFWIIFSTGLINAKISQKYESSHTKN